METDTEYAVYLLDPLYQFHSSATCNDFMSRVRERTLLATFLPKQIAKKSRPSSPGCLPFFSSQSSRDLTLARWKLVRMWERTTTQGTGSLITITFHDRSKNPPKFTEWSLKDFRENAFVLRQGLVVELLRYDLDEHIVFQYESKHSRDETRD